MLQATSSCVSVAKSAKARADECRHVIVAAETFQGVPKDSSPPPPCADLTACEVTRGGHARRDLLHSTNCMRAGFTFNTVRTLVCLSERPEFPDITRQHQQIPPSEYNTAAFT
jgi:hypothetical protein